MSDQTSPPGPPKPDPSGGDDHDVDHGVDPAVDHGADAGAGTTAAPPPPPPPDDTLVGEPPPPPADTAVGAAPPPAVPPRKSRTRLVVGLVAGLIALSLVAVAVVIFVVDRGPATHAISVPASAGGMKRDKDKETELKTQLDATVTQLQTQFKGTSVKRGLYSQDDAKRGPTGELLFVGFKFKTPSEKNPATFVTQLNKLASANQLQVTKVSTGDADGRAVCLGVPGTSAQKNASCLWATRDTVGALFPATPGYDAKQLSKIMIDLRSDVEQTE